MRQYILPCLLGLFFLCGFDMPNDPIVGTWTMEHNDVKIICNSDGTGVLRFDRKSFYEINKTYEGVETKIKWKKKSQNNYVFSYLYPNKISTEVGSIQNGELVFDQGDYANRFKKLASEH